MGWLEYDMSVLLWVSGVKLAGSIRTNAKWTGYTGL